MLSSELIEIQKVLAAQPQPCSSAGCVGGAPADSNSTVSGDPCWKAPEFAAALAARQIAEGPHPSFGAPDKRLYASGRCSVADDDAVITHRHRSRTRLRRWWRAE